MAIGDRAQPVRTRNDESSIEATADTPVRMALPVPGAVKRCERASGFLARV
jgi:hypothetical protein